MRDHWLDEHVGGEAVVRPEFESALGETLQSAWRQPVDVPVGVRPQSGPSRRTQVLIWAAAAAVLLVGGAVVLTQTGKPSVSSSTGDVTVPATSAIAPTVIPVTTVPAETNTEPTAIATTTSLPPTTVAPMVVATSAEQQTVLDYLTALAEERYDDAAKLLGEGGLSLEDRSDLRPFLNADGQIPDLTASLKAWCKAALCQLPTALAEADRRVIATFTIDGVQRTAMFVGATFEGSPMVHGLPLQLPAGVALDDTVQCPTELVHDTGYADLDGDGWYETVALFEGLSGDNTVVVACGTSLVVTAFGIPLTEESTPPNRILLIDIEGDGADELLVATSDPDGFTASVVSYSAGALSATGQTVSLYPTQGISFGCTDFDGDSIRDLVGFTYLFVGGPDISTSTALSYTASLGARSTTDSLALPAREVEAFRLISGYCGNFPTQTG